MPKLLSLGLNPPETRAYAGPAAPLGNPAPFHFLSGGRESDSGEAVTPITAMQSATVAACVRLISESIASMSPVLYARSGTGRTEAFDHPLHDILSLQPNPDCSAFTLWDSFVGSIALHGNGYLEVTRNKATGAVDGLWFLHPALTSAYRQSDGSIIYRSSDGLAPGEFRELSAAQVVHVPWFSTNGVTGVSVIEHARNTIGTDLAMERFGGRFFRNFATPQLALITKKTVKPEDKMKMRQDWESLQTGQNQHRVAILDQEMDLRPISISNADSEWMASRQMSRQAITGLFRVHPSQIGDTARVAGETYAAQQLTFLTYCLRPWLNRIEQELRRKLLKGLPGYSIKHDERDLLRVDFKTQMDGFAVGRQQGFFTPNEVRRELGENPFPSPEADMLTVQVNMMPITRLSLPPAAPTQVTMNE